MAVVTENADLPAGVEPTRTQVTVQLAGSNGEALKEAFNATTAKTIVGRHSLVLDATGSWSLDLAPNTQLVPSGTVWGRTLSGPHVEATRSLATVPGPVSVSAASRTANVVTLTVPSGHGLTVGRTVTVDVADATFDGTFVLTASAATTVQYTQVAADDPTGGTGTVTGHYRWDEILADPPGSLASSALSLHQATALAHGPLRVDDFDGATTFGPVTAVGSGLHVVPVTGAVVTVPDSTRPFALRTKGVIRVNTSDATPQTPPGLFVFVCIAPAGGAELIITQTTQFFPDYMIPVGNATILEKGFSYEAWLNPNQPGDYQIYIGCHNNTTPPSLFTPKPVQLVVAAAHGHYGLKAVAE